MDYVALYAGYPNELDKKVKEHIEMGYKPLGGVSASRYFYIQAMIKEW